MTDDVRTLTCGSSSMRASLALAFAALTLLSATAVIAQTTGSTDRAATAAFKPPTFADDTFTYFYGTQYRNPFTATAAEPDGADITRHSIEFKHVDAWKYGNNLASIVIKSSNLVEPAAGGGAGALGLYAIFRSGLSINRIAGRPVIAAGPLRDISLQGGMNIQTKNTAFAPNERTVYLGPNFQFRFGGGFLNVAVQVRKEWNRNGILKKAEHYDIGYNIAPVWDFPFRIGRARLAFEGFADYNSAKGTDTGGLRTKPEFLARPTLTLDLGSVFGRATNVLELGVGLDYWRNMFGKDADRVPGANQGAPVITLGVHLPLGSARH